MKRYLLLLAFFFVFLNFSIGQTVFHRLHAYNSTENDYGLSGINTTDNYYISCGITRILPENVSALYILKTDEIGNKIIDKAYNFSIGAEIGNSIIELPDNCYSICGTIADTTEQASDTYLFRINENGDSIWFKQIEGGYNDRGIMHKQTPDGGFIIGGYNYDSTFNITQVFLIKTDSLGNVFWQQEYGEINHYNFLKSIDLTPDGGYIIGGDFENPVTNSYDMFLLKTDSLGNPKWKKSFGSTDEEYTGFTVTTSDSGFVIAGAIKMSDSTFNGYIIKTDSDGNIQWNKVIGETGINDYFHQVRQLPDETYIVGGTKPDYSGIPSGARAWLLKLNQQGDTVWSKTYNYYGGSKHTYMEDLYLANDGGFIATGYIINNSLPAKNDLWLLKTDSLGNTCTIDTSTYEGCWSYSCYTVNSQITANADTVYLSEGATVQFGFISNFGTSWQWDFGDTTTSTEQFPILSYTGTGIKTVKLITNSDYCSDTAYYTITVLNDVGIGNQLSIVNYQFSLFPNPANDHIILEYNTGLYKGSEVEIYDNLGRKVLTLTIMSEDKTVVETGIFNNGIYHYMVKNERGILYQNQFVIIK